ncbi:MAG: outer membrane lipoprotein chaperone LolA, partial [Gammaproteobacteria bacterium]
MPARAGGLDQLHEFLSQTHSARGNFSQKVQHSGQTLETTRGVFAFSRPGKFRWEVREPFEQLMVADGERLWFYDKDLDQVTIRKLGNALGSTPAAILFGSTELESGFKLRELDERDGLQWIEALPKNTEQGFDRIAIGLRNGLPEAMEVRDAFARTSVFAFSDIERNPELPDTLFRFTPPPGTGEAGNPEAAQTAMATTMFHWTLHPWAIYAVVGLAVAYGVYRKGRLQLISSAFEPLLGRHAHGLGGKAIDMFAIFATLFGSATSLGLGALQIESGLQIVAGLGDTGNAVLVGI